MVDVKTREAADSPQSQVSIRRGFAMNDSGRVPDTVQTIHEHYARQATPEVWAEVDELRKQAALSDKEAFYFRSIMGNLRQFYAWACDEAQMVTLGTEALGDNIDWLDCWLHRRGLDLDA